MKSVNSFTICGNLFT